MMMGGGLMLIFGLVIMLLVFGLPILLIVAVVAGTWGLARHRTTPTSASQVYSRPSGQTSSIARFCAHCGQGLQADWTHCPNCGAPIT